MILDLKSINSKAGIDFKINRVYNIKKGGTRNVHGKKRSNAR